RVQIAWHGPRWDVMWRSAPTFGRLIFRLPQLKLRFCCCKLREYPTLHSQNPGEAVLVLPLVRVARFRCGRNFPQTGWGSPSLTLVPRHALYLGRSCLGARRMERSRALGRKRQEAPRKLFAD